MARLKFAMSWCDFKNQRECSEVFKCRCIAESFFQHESVCALSQVSRETWDGNWIEVEPSLEVIHHIITGSGSRSNAHKCPTKQCVCCYREVIWRCDHRQTRTFTNSEKPSISKGKLNARQTIEEITLVPIYHPNRGHLITGRNFDGEIFRISVRSLIIHSLTCDLVFTSSFDWYGRWIRSIT